MRSKITSFIAGIFVSAVFLIAIQAWTYQAELDAPVVVPDVTHKIVESITFQNDSSPGDSRTIMVKVKINQWALIDGNWNIIETEEDTQNASMFFHATGSMAGQAGNFKTRIKEWLILVGIINSNDTWS